MTTRVEAIAELAARAVLERFADAGPKPMLLVTNLDRDEIIVLLGRLRELATRRPLLGAEIAVTAREPWEGLVPDDIVPRGEINPTSLRNHPTLPFVLIVGDDFSDRQSLSKIGEVTDTSLTSDEGARAALARLACEREPPRLLLDLLEDEVRPSISPDEDSLPVRPWIDFVLDVGSRLPVDTVVDRRGAYEAIGAALPHVGLFPDPDLVRLDGVTDRRRRLGRNRAETRNAFDVTDDRYIDKLLERLPRVVFRDATGEPESESVADEVRSRVERALTRTDTTKVRQGLLFRHWLDLVEAKSPQRGLGSRVREQIEREHPSRLDELDELDVIDGIDENDESAAKKLLDEPSRDANEKPIVDLIPSRQRTALERVATPKSPRTDAPLASLLRVVATMVAERVALDEPSNDASASIHVEPRDPEDHDTRRSRASFAWLFGATLTRVAEETESDAIALIIHESLLDPSDPDLIDDAPSVEDDDEGADTAPESPGEDADEGFAPLALRLRWEDGEGGEYRLEWDPLRTPGLIAMRRLAHAGAWNWDVGEDVSLDQWFATATRLGPLAGSRDARETAAVRNADPKGLVARWSAVRDEMLATISGRGLRTEVLQDHVERALSLLEDVRDRHVPAGTAIPAVSKILEADTCHCSDGIVLLATHPVRLRWIARYLDWCAIHLVKTTRGELQTNKINPDRFFESALAFSPRAQPPLIGAGDALRVAVRERNWHESYAPLLDSKGRRQDWLADLDDAAFDEIAASVVQYVDAYPHKADGLHLLLFVRRHGSRGLRRVVGKVLDALRASERSEDPSLRLTLYVAPSETADVDEHLQELDDIDRRAWSDHPVLSVTMVPWEEDSELPDLDNTAADVDVAVVPNLFGAAARSDPATRASVDGSDEFDPLLDESSSLVPVLSTERVSDAVARVLLPAAPDRLLEIWSTVAVRQFRGEPVGDADPAVAVDHVKIRVSLGEKRDFFAALHERSHWVVTLDAFVGREQIAALENAPSIIRVKTGVGAAGGYRLVVSSSTGREFVVDRLERRLPRHEPFSRADDRRKIAGQVYDRACLLVPGIVLRSTGLGRTAAEMIGLVLARVRVEQTDPSFVGPHGFRSWISLDEHLDWFGGVSRARADLARLRGKLEGDTFHLEIDVVEAKMRTDFDVGTAETQIDRSIALFEAALDHDESGETTHADSPGWRREILRAIEQTSFAVDGTAAATHVITPDGPSATLGRRLRSALREGKLQATVRGVLVSLVDSDDTTDGTTPRGHRWLRTTEEETRRLLLSLSDKEPFPLHDAPFKEPMTSTTPPQDPKSVERAVADRDMMDSSAKQTAAVPNDSEEPVPPARGGRSETALARAQDLLDSLHRRGVDASPAGGDDAIEGPGFFEFRIVLGEKHRPNDVKSLVEDLQYDLGLAAGRLPRVYVDSGSVVVEIAKRDEERYYIDAEELWLRDDWPENELYAPLGVDVRDRIVGVNFSSSRSPHLLIGGMTGGGKSVALEALLLGLVQANDASRLELRIVDPKGNEFTRFETSAHVREPIGIDAEDAIEMLGRTCEEMDSRYAAMKALSRSSGTAVRDIVRYNALVDLKERFRWIVTVLDEFADLTSNKDDRKIIEGLLQRIAQKARACGIHAIVATQKPSAEVISTTTRSNLGAQLALRVRGSSDSRVIMETSGAESLAGNGDAFLRLSGEEPVRLQCARAGE